MAENPNLSIQERSLSPTELRLIAEQYNHPQPLAEVERLADKREIGGFTPSTREIGAMRENPEVMAYEFLQNLSYGLGYEPPPIVLLCFEDGSRVPFTGHPDEWPQQKIQSVQFITSNPNGITVSDTVISLHDSSKKGLGYWGRGLKHAAAFALSEYGNSDLKIQIDSRYQHSRTGEIHKYSGVYSLDETTSGQTRQLNMHYLERNDDQEQTIVTLHNPPDIVLDTIRNSPETFLYMNPNYRGGVFVPGGHERKSNTGVAYAIEARGMYLDILEDSVLNQRTLPEVVFVDGVKAGTGYYHRFLYPWHIEGGLAQAETAQSYTDKNQFIYRGEDSAKVRNVENLSQIILEATASGSLGEEFWFQTFCRLTENGFYGEIGAKNMNVQRSQQLVEFEYNSSNIDRLPDEARETLQKAWQRFQESHPEIVGVANLVTSTQLEDHYKYNLGEPYKVLVCKGLLDLLKSQDIQGVRSLAQIVAERKKLRSEQIKPIEIQTTLEETGLLELSHALDVLVKNEIKLTYDKNRLNIIFNSNNCGRFFNADHPEYMFPLDESTRQALLTILYMNGEQIKDIEGQFADNGTMVAHFSLKPVPLESGSEFKLLVEGKARDTFEENSQNSLIISVNTLEGSEEIAQAIWQEYQHLAGDLETYETDEERTKRLLAQNDQARRSLQRELEAFIENMDEFKAELEFKMQRQLAEQQQANALKIKQEISKIRRQTLKLAAVFSGATFVTLGAREIEVPEIEVLTNIRDGLWSIKDQLVSLKDGDSIPTIAGDLTLQNNRPIWGLSAEQLLLGNNRAISVDRTQLLNELQQNPREGDRNIRLVNGDSGSMVLLETKRLNGNPGGFYQTSVSNNIETSADNVLVTTVEVDQSSQLVDIPRGRPEQYLVRQHFLSSFPLNKWVPITVRLGEKPVGYAGVQAAEFRQNTYGVWEINITANPEDKELILYTDLLSPEDTTREFLKRMPTEHDKRSLVVFDLLRPDVKSALDKIKKSNLTSNQKVDEALAIWRRLYLYDKDTYVSDEDFPINSSQEYITALINQGIGPCGYAATGAMALIREVGVPANIVGGFINGSYDTDLEAAELHGMVTVWQEESQEWIYIEPQIGRTAVSVTISGNLEGSNPNSVFLDIDSREITRANDASHAFAFSSITGESPQFASGVIMSEGITTELQIPDLGGLYITPEEIERIQGQITRDEIIDKILDSALPAIGITTTYALAEQILAWRKKQKEKTAS